MHKTAKQNNAALNPTLARWIFPLAITSASFFLFYLWQVEDAHAAGNLLLFWLWLSSFIWIFAMFFPDEIKSIPSGTKNLDRFNFLSFLTMMVALVWFGHFATAAFYLAGRFAKSALTTFIKSANIKK